SRSINRPAWLRVPPSTSNGPSTPFSIPVGPQMGQNDVPFASTSPNLKLGMMRRFPRQPRLHGGLESRLDISIRCVVQALDDWGGGEGQRKEHEDRPQRSGSILRGCFT